MMRPPPPPNRHSDPPQLQSSFPLPPVSQRPSGPHPALPPFRNTAPRPARHPHPPSSSSPFAGLVHPQPQSFFSASATLQRADERPFFPLLPSQDSQRKEGAISSRNKRGGAGVGDGASESGEVEEKEYESYDSQLPTRPQADPESQSQLFTLPFPSSQAGVLIPDSAHIPRRIPRFIPLSPHDSQPDLLGDSLPPPSQSQSYLPRPSTNNHPHHLPPPDSQVSQREGAAYQLPPSKKTDTYRPSSPIKANSRIGRPVNVWQMDDPTGVSTGMASGSGGGRRAASVMGRPATAVGGIAGPARGAAELFLASSQQQGGAKTASEKIMEALSSWSTTILNTLAEVKKDQKQVRDQAHELQTGQRALATRQEVTEEITAQLSPALHEFFQSLHTRLDGSTGPIPEKTASLATEKIKMVLMEMKQIEGSQRSQEENQNTPVAKLMDHLISKLDSVSRISDFLQSYKELPEALRDVAVYKQSMDSLMAMAKNGPGLMSGSPFQHQQQQAPAPHVDVAVYRQLQDSIAQLGQKLDTFPISSTTQMGREENDDRVIQAITSLAQGLDRLPLHPAPAPPHSHSHLPSTSTFDPQVQTDILHLRANVDTLSSDIRDIKAMLVQQQLVPQSTLDVANIVSQLKSAWVPPPTSSHAPIQAYHSFTPMPDIGEDGANDLSHIQPTEIGTSQPGHVHDLPTSVSKARIGRSSTIAAGSFTPSATASLQPLQPINPNINTNTNHAATSARALPLPQVPTAKAGMTFANGRFTSHTSTAPTGTSSNNNANSSKDVFGPVRPTSDIRTDLGPSSGINTSLNVTPARSRIAMSVMDDEDEEGFAVDTYDDIFGPTPPPSKDVSGGKGQAKGIGIGKRPLHGAAAASVARLAQKRARTNTNTKANTTVSSSNGKGHVEPKRPISTPADLNLSADGISTPGSIAADLLLASNLKRSDRIAAQRTISNNPVYGSDSPGRSKRRGGSGGSGGSGSSTGRRKGGGWSKMVKQEIIVLSSSDEIPLDHDHGGKQDEDAGHSQSSFEQTSLGYGYVPPTSSPGLVENQLDSQPLPSFGVGDSQAQSDSRNHQTQVASQGETVGQQTLTSYGQVNHPAPMKFQQRYSRRKIPYEESESQ